MPMVLMYVFVEVCEWKCVGWHMQGSVALWLENVASSCSAATQKQESLVMLPLY